jgi:hypothetical protein
LPNLGSYQDGGLNKNNPVRLAIWEAPVIWPAINRPTSVLSLGTGTSRKHGVDVSLFRNFLTDGFLSRGYKLLKSRFDEEDDWGDLWNGIERDERHSYTRMNISVGDEALALDNPEGMDSLGQEVLDQYQAGKDIEDVAIGLLLSRLFFVLDDMPTLTAQGFYCCRGTIRSRLPGYSLLQVVSALQIGPCFFVLGQEVLACTDWHHGICKVCHRYGKKVQFFIRNTDQPITISLTNDSLNRKVSSFLQSID